MTKPTRFALTLETLAELAPEIGPAAAPPAVARPNLSEVLAELSPLPREALFLGVANDGLPVLLNLFDPVPGPILIAGDAGSGKTHLLQVIAQAVERGRNSDNLRYTIVTDNTKEWERFDPSGFCEGILAFRQPLTTNYLTSLVEWAHDNKHGQEFVFLLIDGLEALAGDHEIHQVFRWLFLRGPSRRIRPIVTLNAAQLSAVSQWLPSFHTRLGGRMQNEQHAKALMGTTNFPFRDLLAGSQFTMREGNNWLPFWIPNLD